MDPIKSLTKLLGGRATLKTTLENEDDLLELVRAGLPYESFEAVARALQMTVDDASASVGIKRRTLSRRKQQDARLNKQESERALRLARIAVRAEDALGSMEKAYRWLRAPNRALGGKKPIELLDVDLGAERVGHVLGRIEHGVFG